MPYETAGFNFYYFPEKKQREMCSRSIRIQCSKMAVSVSKALPENQYSNKYNK